MLQQAPDEFWELSLREFDAVMQAFLRWQDVDNYRMGTVAAAAWNAQRADGKRKSWRVWKDFLPAFLAPKKRGLSLEEMRAQAMKMRADVYGK